MTKKETISGGNLCFASHSILMTGSRLWANYNTKALWHLERTAVFLCGIWLNAKFGLCFERDNIPFWLKYVPPIGITGKFVLNWCQTFPVSNICFNTKLGHNNNTNKLGNYQFNGHKNKQNKVTATNPWTTWFYCPLNCLISSVTEVYSGLSLFGNATKSCRGVSCEKLAKVKDYNKWEGTILL